MTPETPGNDAHPEQNQPEQDPARQKAEPDWRGQSRREPARGEDSALGGTDSTQNSATGGSGQPPRTPAHAEDAGDSRAPGRYGLRFEDMSAEELEYYRPFWEKKPDPDEVPPELIDHLKVRARRRMVNTLGLIAVVLGVMLTLSGMLSGALYLSIPGAFAFGIGVFGWVAVRRRLFSWLRLPGEGPLQRGERSRWWILPHLLAGAGTASVLASFSVIPMIYAQADDTLRRNHVVMWGEIGTTLLIFAALVYGMMALGEYTQQDEDERVLRPTDYAERKAEQTGEDPQIPRYRPGMLNPHRKDDSSS